MCCVGWAADQMGDSTDCGSDVDAFHCCSIEWYIHACLYYYVVIGTVSHSIDKTYELSL